MAPASSSNATCATTVCSTPSSRAHTLLNRTPFHPLGTQPLDSREPSGGTACSHGRQLKSPTDQSQEPENGAGCPPQRGTAAYQSNTGNRYAEGCLAGPSNRRPLSRLPVIRQGWSGDVNSI